MIQYMKISEFNRIIISGNIFNNTQLEFFPNNKKTLRICNIYGKNGTGKSTISKGIKSNYENIVVKILILNLSGPKELPVFNITTLIDCVI